MPLPRLMLATELLTTALLTTALLAGCASSGYPDTPLPSQSTATPTAAAAPTTAAATTSAPPCTNATQSYDPLPSLPASASLTGRMAEVRTRGYLIAGVSADTLLLGARNPLTGQLEGFDIDLVHATAQAIFGDPNKVQFTVITAAQRLDALKNRTVDIVVRNMTQTCARWNDIAFSAEYYHAGQKVLVPKGSTAKTLDDLAGKKVCAPNGTSSMATLAKYPKVVAVGSDTHTGCLVLFQQGQVDAITGDDTVLAGLVAQDPYAYVPPGDPITSEPYGIGFNKADTYFAQYVNRLLAEMKADGRWKAIYDKWFAGPLGPAPAPPTAVYGRA
jgi:polar amino acid transport system substrate-binding protein